MQRKLLIALVITLLYSKILEVDLDFKEIRSKTRVPDVTFRSLILETRI